MERLIKPATAPNIEDEEDEKLRCEGQEEEDEEENGIEPLRSHQRSDKEDYEARVPLRSVVFNKKRGPGSQAGGNGRDTKSTMGPLSLYVHRQSVVGDVSDKAGGGGGSSEGDSKVCVCCLTFFSWLLFVLTLPFSLCLAVKVVQEYERVVIFRLGRLSRSGVKGPGVFFIMPCIDTYQKVDLRTVTFDVPPQEVLTQDSVTVSVDAVVYYRVNNAIGSVANVENAHNSTRLLAQTTLRNVLGTKSLAAILSERDGISIMMKESLDNATEEWGIQVERVEIKDVRLPIQLQRAMAAEAEASREAKAKVIAANGEFDAAQSLKTAAEIITQSPAALQLRYLQTLNSISSEKNSTIIFPVPIECLGLLFDRNSPNKRPLPQ